MKAITQKILASCVIILFILPSFAFGKVIPTPIDTFQAPKTWVLLVGVARYQHLKSLKYTDDNVYRVYAFFKSPEGGGLPEEQIEVLIDEDANQENIIKHLIQLQRKARVQDNIVVYLAGQTQANAIMCINSKDLGLSYQSITHILDKSKAKNKIVFIDGVQPQPTSIIKSTLFNTQTGFIISENGIESNELRQSVFGHFLIRGLKGEANLNKDKFITLGEIYTYVYQQVKAYFIDLYPPYLLGFLDQDLIISIPKE